ncbi:MAG: hypothetical protein WA886_23875, partial [Candidatus Acidiferrales bacterium]
NYSAAKTSSRSSIRSRKRSSRVSGSARAEASRCSANIGPEAGCAVHAARNSFDNSGRATHKVNSSTARLARISSIK